MTLTDIEEYSFRLNNVLDCTIYNQITVGNITLPKAVLSTVKIFAVYILLAAGQNPQHSKNHFWLLSSSSFVGRLKIF